MDANNVAGTRPGLSDAKRTLLEQRLRGTGKSVAPRSEIVRRGGGPAFPMSFAQERMWFLDQMEPGSPYYNIPVATIIIADPDLDALERALSEIVRRHEATRTVFRLVDGVPMQIVTEPYELKVRCVDVRNGRESVESLDEIQELVSEEGRKPFDLANGPLFRAALFRVSEEDAVIVLTLHHIITDGWSMPLVTAEMEALYTAFLRGEPSPLPELDVQYSDYSAWQREYLTGKNLDRQVDYWREHLGGAPTLELPYDRPRPALQTFAGDFHRWIIPASIAVPVRELSRREMVTVNMTVMAVLNVLLSRLSGQDDVVVGTLLGNRNRKETEALIGFFVNTAACRFDLSGDPTFRELLGRVRKVVLDADAHQDLPWERLVEKLNPERDLSRHPIFDVMYFHHTFVQAHGIQQEALATALQMRPLYENGVSLVDIGIARFDLVLATLELAEDMPAMIEYSTDLFDKETILRFAEHLETLLDAASANPDARISELPIVRAGEQARVLAEWSAGPETAFPADQTLHALVARHAAATPDAVAVTFGGATVSYAELDRRADLLARRLVALGLQAEDRVALCLERGPELMVAVLGTLKAGGAYVPVDPAYPAERRAYMLSDSGARFVVAQPHLVAELPPHAATVVAVEAGTGELADRGDLADSLPAVAPESLAYLIYTSGSTGQPKGVMVPHRGAVNLATAGIAKFGLDAGTRFLQFASSSFDASVIEWTLALLSGGRLVMGTRDEVTPGPALVELMRRERVSAALLPPTVLGLLPEGELPDFQVVISGGEACSPELAARWARGRRFFNAYGPTEITVASSVAEVAAETGGRRPPIGRPLPNTRSYVLDGKLQPLPIGVPGELYVGGAGVTRGYLGRAALTAGRYLPDPFSGRAGARMYRTGDRARWLPTGELEFMGRLDEQVKVRGFRIELGEVESAVRRHPAVGDAVVTVREVAAGDRRLVAYYTGEEAPAAPELRTFLRQSLPDYMVPAHLVRLEAIPLTAGGKVDRRALPDPEAQQAREAEAAGTALPASEMEETLSRIWGEVLRVPRVGTHDNFFELGGDSILCVQVMARAAQEGIRLTPKQMFQHQTVAELALVAGRATQVLAEQGVVEGEVPLIPVQHWFFEGGRPEPEHWNMAVALEMAGEPDAAALEGAVAAVMAHHDALRTRFDAAEAGWTQRVAGLGGALPLERIDLSGVAAEEREAAFTERCAGVQRSLDLASGPLVRFAWFHLGGGERDRLVAIAHHLVMDMVSWGVLMEDLANAYAQLAGGEEVKLPRKSTSFRQWSEKLSAHAASGAMDGEAAFWTDPARAGVAPLPRDGEGGENTEGDAVRLAVALDAETTRALLQDVPPVYSTQVNDVLLTALLQAFARWTGRGELLVDLEGHGRVDLFEDVDLSRTVGWFTTIYPLLLGVRDPADVGGSIKAVKETLRAVPNQGIGYGMLRYLGADAEVRRRLAALPAAEVAFNYLGQMGGAVGSDEGAAPEAEAESFFSGAAVDTGASRSPRETRPHLIGVDALVTGGELQATWTFSPAAHSRATVEALAEGFLDALRGIVEHCKDPEAGGFTPSDFGIAGLDQGGLDALMAQLGELG